MQLKVTCDYCGKEFLREECRLRGKKHHFCSRQCLADFSSKTKNPNKYLELKDFTNIGETLRKVNKKLNPSRMTPEVREKIRLSRLNKGACKGYSKYYGLPEHRIVAEQMLGRALLPGEVVHHIDGNKRNNNPSNLRIFESQSEHARFHAELSEVLKLLNS